MTHLTQQYRLHLLYNLGEIQERDDEVAAPCTKCGTPTVHRARLWDGEAGYVGPEIACEATHDLYDELRKVIV